eukprot:GDKJ01048178.1.p1 GENE.GDKJ01048178.1~~GDKJ01048178.1.p1  ORF type:complete len:1240 (+),score=339.64 GDKJ01048178.1:29-3748(+)
MDSSLDIPDLPNLPTDAPDLESLMRSRGMEPEDLRIFNEKAEKINDIVQKLIKGEITPDQAESEHIKLNIKDKVKEMKIRERHEKVMEQKRMGRDGKGESSNYYWVCRGCSVEYDDDFEIKAPMQHSPAVFPRSNPSVGNEEVPADVEPLSVEPPQIDALPTPERCEERACCRRCGKKMMTRDERHQELRVLVEESRLERLRRKERRGRWERYQKEQSIKIKSSTSGPTVYDKWRFWEPSEDEDEKLGPILPKNNPEFRALEKDLDESMRKRVDRRKAAIKMKELGNACLKNGDYATAIRHYKEGLEKAKDMTPLWTNRALAEVKLGMFQDAIESCKNVIDIAEIFDNGFERNKDANFKAFTRRAMAYRGLGKWEEAVADLEMALKLVPSEKEAVKMLQLTREAWETQKVKDALAAETLAKENEKLQKLKEEEEAKKAKENQKIECKIEDVTEEEEQKEAERKKLEEEAHHNAVKAAEKLSQKLSRKKDGNIVSSEVDAEELKLALSSFSALEKETRIHARRIVEMRNQVWPAGNVSDPSILAQACEAWREGLEHIDNQGLLDGALYGLENIVSVVLKDVPDTLEERKTKSDSHLLHLVDILNIQSFARNVARFAGFLWGAPAANGSPLFADANSKTQRLRIVLLEIILRMLECEVTRDGVIAATEVCAAFCRLLIHLFTVSTRETFDASSPSDSCLSVVSPSIKYTEAELSAAILVNLTVQPRGRKSLRIAFPPPSAQQTAASFMTHILPKLTLTASSILSLGLTRTSNWKTTPGNAPAVIDPRSHLGGLAASLLAHLSMDDEMRTVVSKIALPKTLQCLHTLTKWALGFETQNLDPIANLMQVSNQKPAASNSLEIPTEQLKNAAERTKQLLALLHNVSVAVSAATNASLPESSRKAALQCTQHLSSLLSRNDDSLHHPLMTLVLLVFSPRDEMIRTRAAGVLVRLLSLAFQTKQIIPNAVLEASELLMRAALLFNKTGTNHGAVSDNTQAKKRENAIDFGGNLQVKDACIRLLNLLILHENYLSKLVASPNRPFSVDPANLSPQERLSLASVKALAAEALGFDPRAVLADGFKSSTESDLVSLLLSATFEGEEEQNKGQTPNATPEWSLAILASRLCEVLKESAPKDYVQAVNNGASGRDGLTSLVGNTASVMQQLLAFVDSQGGAESKIAAVKEVNVRTAIVPLIETVRKETGVAQKNAVTALARLARDDRYSQTVRNLGGIDSLTQIGSRLIAK